MYQILKPKNYITIVKIPIIDIDKIDVIMGNKPKESIQNCFNRLGNKPDFIVNGGLFDMKSGDTITTTVDEGKLIRDNYGSYFGLKIFKDLKFKFEAYKKSEDIKDFIGSSPSLVIDSKVNIQNPLDKDFMNGLHPRLSLGMNNEYFFIVTVDGRRISARGMTIKELASFMLNELKCISALNEDGGGSLQLGQNDNGKFKYLNNPTENRLVDNFIGVYLKKLQKKNLYQVTANKLNIRQSPSLISKVVDQYSQNTIVEVLEIKNGWGKTNKGYVSINYLQKV